MENTTRFRPPRARDACRRRYASCLRVYDCQAYRGCYFFVLRAKRGLWNNQCDGDAVTPVNASHEQVALIVESCERS